MTKEEALKLALEALEMFCEHGAILRPIETRNAIQEALAQPEQEPFGYFRYDMRLDAWVMNREGQRPGTPFYTTPPQRTWQRLTEEDFSAINQSCLTKLQAAASAESILKEKNT